MCKHNFCKKRFSYLSRVFCQVKQTWTCQYLIINNHIRLVLGRGKMFWKEVQRVRKGEQARDEMVKNVNGQILRDSVEVRRR